RIGYGLMVRKNGSRGEQTCMDIIGALRPISGETDRMLKKFAGAAILPLVALAGPAFGQADAVAEFYENETISVVIGYPPGGGFDAATRLLLRYMPKYMPGEPEMIPINMPGAGSLLVANHLFNTAEADGTEFGLIGGSMPFSPLWDDEGIRFDATEFSWIGSTDRWVGIALI